MKTNQTPIKLAPFPFLQVWRGMCLFLKEYFLNCSHVRVKAKAMNPVKNPVIDGAIIALPDARNSGRNGKDAGRLNLRPASRSCT
ncbi:hypothetical protein [Burkholderia ubonensis]|uniref:hypothetical protein n=1 Tax=Burkholderia ubonensis TaxID=101571 RepID=UPI0012FB13B6|nr:hypothetical protein [Burkholderia ubonensis]